MRRFSILALGLLTVALVVAPSTRRAVAETPAQAEHGARTEGGHAAPGHAGGHDAPAAEPNILELKPSLSIATLLVFGLLLAVLWRFAWGPLAKALHDREHNMEHALHAAEHARAEADRLLAEHRAQMAQAADQVRAIIEEARRDAQSTADEILKKAHAESESTRQRAEREIGTARDQALLEIWTKTADLAVTVAGKVLAKQLNPDDHRRLVEVAKNELPAAPNGRGGHAA